MVTMRKITGVIFSDLGQASSFMALDYVQQALNKCLGYFPFPATLNVRPKAAQDAEVWQRIQTDVEGVPLPSAAGGFCRARLYRVAIGRPGSGAADRMDAAVLLPEVVDYPKDKIEIVAPVRLKEAFTVQDGDQLTLEFIA
jgi:CTP-dependent riboflavin kinase